MARVRAASPAQRRRLAAMRRDGALARLSSLTAAIGVAIIVALGVLGLYVGRALPGHQSHSTTGSSSSAGSTTAGGTGTSSAASQGGLNPASTPTQSTSLPPPVVSGAS